MNTTLSRLKENLVIDPTSMTPKYLQIANQVKEMIRKGILIKGDKLPPINIAYREFGISRDTLIAAYKELQNKKIISSAHGKGFFVRSTRNTGKERVFILFDVMNGYKEVLYRSLVDKLGKNYECDIFFHYYNLRVFEKALFENSGDYDHYVIMPHFNDDVSSIVSQLPADKTIIIDKNVPALNHFKSVYQDFHNDVKKALAEASPLLDKYSCLCFIVNRKFQFIPDGIINGFREYCRENEKVYAFVEDLESHTLKKGNAYIVFTDKDLVKIIKSARSKQLSLGKNIGILSYDETELKEVLMGGISVMSTDFREMGKTAAKMIMGKTSGNIINPFHLITRKSL